VKRRGTELAAWLGRKVLEQPSAEPKLWMRPGQDGLPTCVVSRRLCVDPLVSLLAHEATLRPGINCPVDDNSSAGLPTWRLAHVAAPSRPDRTNGRSAARPRRATPNAVTAPTSENTAATASRVGIPQRSRSRSPNDRSQRRPRSPTRSHRPNRTVGGCCSRQRPWPMSSTATRPRLTRVRAPHTLRRLSRARQTTPDPLPGEATASIVVNAISWAAQRARA
jgi:hypothetical protein